MMRLKYLIMPILALAAGCSEIDEHSTKDKISITPDTQTVSDKGGKTEIVVSSSADWTLSGEYEWAVPSARAGKDGDVVSFEVAANETEQDKTAEFVFSSGSASAVFTLISRKMEGSPDYLEIVSAVEDTVAFDGGDIEILVNSNTSYRELKINIPQDATEWLSHKVTLEGSGDHTAKVILSIKKNEGLSDRECTVGIAGNAEKKAEMKVFQLAEPVLATDETAYYIGLEGGDIDVAVTSNVEYEVIVEEGADWISYEGKTDGKEKFVIASGDAERNASVTFLQKGGGLSAVITIGQKNPGLINTVADMTDNWAWPAWTNPDPVTDMEQLTMEALVNVSDFKENGKISTIMGIEGMFLIRLGDSDIPSNQICVPYTPDSQWGLGSPGKFTDENMVLDETNRWYHIAVTFNKGDMYCYIDGEQKGHWYHEWYFDYVNLGVPHNDETEPDENGNIQRCFWVGYSFDRIRDLKGMMSEVRIWNRALTQDEINAENHFYSVDPESEGLVAYWKFDGGESNVVKDYSKYGNDMQTRKEMNWVSVSIP